MTQKTNFGMVADMNERFKNKQGDPYLFQPMPYHTINAVPEHLRAIAEPVLKAADEAWTRLEKQCKNIVKEYEELMAGIAERDVIKVRDALCDINVFSYGGHHMMGYDADRDMEAVIKGVLTRFVKNDDQFIRTQQHYQNLGVEYYVEGSYPNTIFKSSKDQGYTEDNPNPEYPKGKFLKPVGYSQPVFYHLVPKSVLQISMEYGGPNVNESIPGVTETAALPTSVTDQMANARVLLNDEGVRKMRLINDQVNAYRSKLEEEAFGLPPYDYKKGI